MYSLSITAMGTEYNFGDLTANSVKELVNNSYRVTNVTVWHDGMELDREAVMNLIYGNHLTAV